MNSLLVRLIALLVFISALSCANALAQKRSKPTDNQVLEAVTSKTEIYAADANADQEIKEALQEAAKDNRRVLLIFGANWCYDCHVLDRALHEGSAGTIVSNSYLLVHVDIGEGNKNTELAETYRIPLNKGVPAVAVLNAEGKLLYSSGDGQFESARTMFKRDLVAFLNKWKGRITPPRANHPVNSGGTLWFRLFLGPLSAEHYVSPGLSSRLRKNEESG